MSSPQTTDYLSSLKNLDEDFQCYMIMAIIFILLIQNSFGVLFGHGQRDVRVFSL